MILPKHINLHLEHNAHACNYETVKDHFESQDLYDFIDEADKQLCINQNDFWSCQWYPNTPVGFNCVAASSLEKLLKYLEENCC